MIAELTSKWPPWKQKLDALLRPPEWTAAIEQANAGDDSELTRLMASTGKNRQEGAASYCPFALYSDDELDELELALATDQGQRKEIAAACERLVDS